MKTNKQRAEFILQKASKLKEDGFTEIPQPKKKIVLWKVITAISCAVLVLAGAITGLVVGILNNGYNIDKMYIANFGSYTAIGSGHINSSQQTASAAGMDIAYAASSEQSNGNYLMGQKSDGSFEKVSFSKTQNGKPEKEQQGYITQALSFNRFTFIEWNLKQKVQMNSLSNNGRYLFNNYNTHSAWDYKTFVIDNQTGKIFDISNINIHTLLFDFRYVYGMHRLDADDCVYFYTETWGDSSCIFTFYKVSIEKGELKVEEVIRNDIINFCASDVFSDKYGNLYLSDKSNNSGNLIDVKYCISNGNVINIDKVLFKSVSGIVYTEDKTQKVNENGQLVPNTFTDCDLILSKENLIKKVGNIDYYYGELFDEYPETELFEKIYKITWKNDEEYSYEIIPVEEYTKTFVTTSDKIYFLEEESIFSIDIETGKKIEQDIGTDYIFNSIQTDNLGNVLFEGITKLGMKNVSGIIDNDGNASILEKNRKYVIYYIKALN